MKHLKRYNLFDGIFEANTGDVIDLYLGKIGTDRQYIIDIFQGVVDLGYEPKFKLVFIDKDGVSRKEKSSAEETPIVLVSFKTDKAKYVGGSQRFSNLDYLESLYHGLSMFMSMFSDKCKVQYDIDNYVELELRLEFPTEYDETKIAVSKDEIRDALQSCLSLVPAEYTSDINVNRKNIILKSKPENSVGQRLLDQLKASKTAKVASNDEEIEKIGNEVVDKLAKVLSDNLKKDIRFVKADGVPFYDAVSQLLKGTGLYLFIDDKQSQKIAKVRVTNHGASKRYLAKIKRGFLKIDECEIELETLEIDIEML